MKHNIFKIRKLGEPIQTKELSEAGTSIKPPSEVDVLKHSIQATNEKMLQLMTMFESFMKSSIAKPTTSVSLNSPPQAEAVEMEVRDRHVELSLPATESVTKQQAEKWITQVCTTAFSASFHYYLTEQLTFEQTKVFCSESILRNILLFTSKYKLTDKQMENVNNHIGQRVLQYLQKKYPLTQSNDVNKALQREVQETNHLDLLTHDFLNTFGIMFKYSPDGNYNDMIMRVINKAIEMAEQTSVLLTQNEEGKKNQEPETNYGDFQNYMSDLFENVFDEDWMMGSRAKADRSDSDATYIAKKVSAEAQKFKYEEKVRSYTNYLIGRKLSENTVPYTQNQITSKNLVIKTPAILRILTKWCQQLWEKFESQNYFTSRTESLQLQDPEIINPFFKWMKSSLDQRVAAEKKAVLAFKAELDNNSYHQQSQFLLKHLEEDNITSIPKYEKAYGKFATQMVKNLHSYITLYLNRLIHGLLTVSKGFFESEVDKSWDDWQAPPNLITFKTGDLFRCKIASKQKQIIKLYKEIKRISNVQPKKMKIVRIKNRLKQGTNDILINVKFNNLIICQVQLEVTNKSKSKFIQCSNNFSHYIYQMRRSIFGPVSELCNIWNNFQARAQQYQSIVDVRKENTIQKVECLDDKSQHIFNKFDLPFQCSFCKKLYYHNNYIIFNKKCQKCSKYKCVKCQINGMEQDELKKVIFNSRKFKQLSKSTKRHIQKTIPNFGVCIKIQSTFINIEVFKLTKYEGKTWLLGNKDDHLYNIKKLSSPKDNTQFLEKYCIFEIISNNSVFITVTEKMAQNFATEEYIKESYKQQKQVLILTQLRYSAKQMTELMKVDGGYQRNKRNIKRIQYASNYLDDISYFSCFQNLTSLNLDFNNFTNMKIVCNFTQLQKLQMRDNTKLNTFDEEVCKLSQLEEIKVNNCKITAIPESIGQLSQLTNLKMDKNALTAIPDSLCKNTNLKELSLQNNTIKSLPNYIGNLTNLRKLIVKKNNLSSLPLSIGNLLSLQILDLSQNSLKEMPQSILYLTKIQILRLDNNQFQQIPSAIFSLGSLKVLSLFSNKIKNISNSFNNFKNLEILQLHSNEIIELPETLSNCANLTELSLHHNKLKSIPNQFSKLKRLKPNFDLNNNELTDFPTFVFAMDVVAKINLENNFITEIPKDISILQELTELNLTKNKLKEVIDEMTKLSNLKKFSIKYNQITKIPTFIKDIPFFKADLKNLGGFFSNNKINEFESSQILDIMEDKIILTQNQLTFIPIELISHKQKVTMINLFRNKIKQVPLNVNLFINLTSLNLSRNQIEIVPKVLEQLSKLKVNGLSLEYNPLKKVECLDFCRKVGNRPTVQLINTLVQEYLSKQKHESQDIADD